MRIKLWRLNDGADARQRFFRASYHVDTGEERFATGWSNEARQNLYCGGLAGAVRSQVSHTDPWLYCQVQIIQCRELAKLFAQVLCYDGIGHAVLSALGLV